ncbi:MAG TPA: DUF6089 family protein [Chitinophagaceae bacterium]|nr:DUF6089 family protein [Chitinophagaceae bacterium]
MNFKWLIYTLSFSFLILTTQESKGQVFYTDDEFGLTLGASTYFGDLNPDYNVLHPKPALGIFYKNHLHPYISVRASLTYTQFEFKDSWSNNDFQKIRNLQFKNNILELAVLGEFNFFYFSTGRAENRFTPHLLLGLAALRHNPFTHLDSRKYYLKPAGTEGQNMAEYKDRRYSNFAIAIPVGAGFKYWIRPGLNLSVDLLHRFTFTDYIDDVSTQYVEHNNYSDNNINQRLSDRSLEGIGKAGKQRGDNASFDEYFIFQVSLSLQFKTYKCPKNFNNVYF